ncbi:MAG TPA: sugar ABC transporter permease [Chloroflexota bacterium]|jgi:ABC-type sugar transport system permease subunit
MAMPTAHAPVPLAARRRLLRPHGRVRAILASYLFMLPSLLVIGIFMFWPIIQIVWFSLHQWSFIATDHPYVGADNYRQLANDSRFWGDLHNTLLFTVGVVPASVLLPLPVAVALNRRLRGRAFFRAAYFLPAVSSYAVMAIVWSLLLQPDIGLLSRYFKLLHFPVADWLHDPSWALPAIMLVGIWKTIGFNMVILLTGIQGIPETYYEAAQMDGASTAARFFRITLPLLRPTLLFVTVTSMIASFQIFDPVFVMTGGGPLFSTETLVTYIYHEGFQLFDTGYASTLACILFLIMLALTVVQLRVFRFQEED